LKKKLCERTPPSVDKKFTCIFHTKTHFVPEDVWSNCWGVREKLGVFTLPRGYGCRQLTGQIRILNFWTGLKWFWPIPSDICCSTSNLPGIPPSYAFVTAV